MSLIALYKKSEKSNLLFVSKNERFERKTQEPIPNPDFNHGQAMVKLNMNPKMVSINLFSVSLNSFLFVPMSSSPETN